MMIDKTNYDENEHERKNWVKESDIFDQNDY